MIKCAYCGKKNVEDAKFCSYCGEKILHRDEIKQLSKFYQLKEAYQNNDDNVWAVYGLPDFESESETLIGIYRGKIEDIAAKLLKLVYYKLIFVEYTNPVITNVTPEEVKDVLGETYVELKHNEFPESKVEYANYATWLDIIKNPKVTVMPCSTESAVLKF